MFAASGARAWTEQRGPDASPPCQGPGQGDMGPEARQRRSQQPEPLNPWPPYFGHFPWRWRSLPRGVSGADHVSEQSCTSLGVVRVIISDIGSGPEISGYTMDLVFCVLSWALNATSQVGGGGKK